MKFSSYKGAYFTPARALHHGINVFVLTISKEFRSSMGQKWRTNNTYPHNETCSIKKRQSGEQMNKSALSEWIVQ